MVLGAGRKEPLLRLVPFGQAPEIGHMEFLPVLATSVMACRASFSNLCRIGRCHQPLLPLFRFAVDDLGRSGALRVLDRLQALPAGRARSAP